MQFFETSISDEGENAPLRKGSADEGGDRKRNGGHRLLLALFLLPLAFLLILVSADRVGNVARGDTKMNVVSGEEAAKVGEDYSVCGAKNVAFEKFTGQIQLYSRGRSSLAVDGNTNQNAAKCATAYYKRNPWWYVKIGKNAAPVCAVRVFNRIDGTAARLVNFQIFVTDRQPVRGQQFVVKPSEVCFYYKSRKAFDVKDFKCNRPLKGAFVGLQIMQTQWLSICEFEVFTTERLTHVNLPSKCDKPKLLSHGRPTNQFSQYAAGVPSWAVDGNTNQNYNGHSCSFTNYAKKPWWYVDVGAGMSVCSVKIWNRKDSAPSRLTNFKIFVTNRQPQKGVAFSVLSEEVCYYDGSKKVFSIKSFTCKKPLLGRYVGVQLMGTSYLTLCEVKVFGQKAPPTLPVACVPGGPRNGNLLNNYGTMVLPASGVLRGMTLDYYSGKLYFNAGKCVGGRWGFSFPPAGKLGYQVYVTDGKKKLLFPTRNTHGLTTEVANKCYRFAYGPLSVVNMDWVNGQKFKIVLNKPMKVRRGQTFRLYTGHNLFRHKLAAEDHGETCGTVHFDYVKQSCPPGQYFDNIRLYSCAVCPSNFYCPGKDLVIPCPKGTVQPKSGQVTCVKRPTVCVLGQNFNFNGNPCIISGDPHQTSLFSGGRMEFMGTKPNTNQYYYVSACAGTKSRSIMPFNILGTHSGGRISGLDYLTLELFDRMKKRHLVFLNAGKYGYVANAPSSMSTLYPRSMSRLTSGKLMSFGKESRFQIRYTNVNRKGLRLELFVDLKLITTITMINQWLCRGGLCRGQYVLISPIREYQCHVCGLCGSFKRKGNFIPKCNGGFMHVPAGYGPKSFSSNGLTWRKGACNRKPVLEKTTSPCPKGSAAEGIARTSCAKQRQLYTMSCSGYLVKICDRLLRDCVADVCLLGVKNADRNAKAIYGRALGELKKDKSAMKIDFGAQRTKNAASEVMIVVGGNDFSPYDVTSGMQNGQGGKKQHIVEKFEYKRALGCGKSGVFGGVLNGFDMTVGTGKLASVSVSVKGLSKFSGEGTVKTWGKSMVFGGAFGYVASCFSPSKLDVFSLRPLRKKVLSWKDGTSLVVAKSVSMTCGKPLAIFTALNLISVKTGIYSKRRLQISLQSSVMRGVNLKQASARVSFSSFVARNVVDVGALVVAICPSAVQKSSKLSADLIRTGVVALGEMFPSPNRKERTKYIHGCLDPPLSCNRPSVTVGFLELDISNGYQVEIEVESGSVCATGFDIKVESWGETDVHDLTVSYLAVCPN